MKLIAEIKAILVHLAADDQLPLDMNELGDHVFDPIIEKLSAEIDSRAKIQALNQYLSEYPTDTPYEKILDIISTGEADHEENGILIWEQFEGIDPATLAECIENSYICISKGYESIVF